MSREVKVIEHPFEEMVILPPKPGVCPICAANHEPAFPHNRDSLYYQMRFRQEHGRFPTWADAMEHCTQEMKDWFIDEYRKRGIIIEAEEHNGGKRMDQQAGTNADG